ncbi:hypothetical protein SKM57_11280 [Acinetobacter faecalis]|uniref:hypothetical protein n=1 Tax=Acinetobacter faecalis TaxID=2665161 RepID=UPI002A90A94E|nr:hypothetical protein [Acinetobacter faecalis]MDY6469162.1 hypothetical protein [Acinetobacter faecalis]
MENKKYQVRIRKDVTFNPGIQESLALLGGCTATEIQTRYGNFESIHEAFEKLASMPEMEEYEIISVILYDSDNSEQLGDEFNWDEVA